MSSETIVVGRVPLKSHQTYAEERADPTKRDLPERHRKLRENISNNQPLSNINNAWRESFAGDRAVKPKFPESRSFPLNVQPAHHRPESSGAREEQPCSVLKDCPSASKDLQTVTASSIAQSSLLEYSPNPSQNSHQAVTTSPKTPILRSALPEIHPSPLRIPLQAVTTAPKSPIVQSSLQENRPSPSHNPPQGICSIEQNPLTGNCSSASPQAITAHVILQSSSLPETGQSALRNPPQIVTSSSIVQHPQILCPDYSDPRRVPGTDQNIYPRGPIDPEFHERYPYLVDFFKQAVDAHKLLKYHTSKINYELRLCGRTPSSAVASIIIFCAEVLFKDLRTLLSSKHIRRQYEPTKASLWDKFQFAPSKPHSQAFAPILAPFRIVYWREASTPTQRRATMEQVVAKNHSLLTMCGSMVKYGDRTSTLGLLISVDSKLYGMTVDHLFKTQRHEEQPTIANEPSLSSDEEDAEGDQTDWPWIDEVKYDDIDNDGWISDNGIVTSGTSHVKVATEHGLAEHFGASVKGHKVDSLLVTDTAKPYLDWALIEFDDGYYERPNAFYSEDDPANPKFIGRVSAAPKTSEVKVFMISGVSGTRKGVMLNSSSYIGGKPGENLCQAWNVILSNSGRVIDGDCGSLIVDQETLEVYGHVVASNPLGEAYVVPLQDTFHQISHALGAKNLSLPDPGLLMESLVTYCSKVGDRGVTPEAKQILASTEELSSTNRQFDAQDQARQSPVAWSEQTLKWSKELESSGPFSVLIRRLPANTTDDTLRLMVVWSKDLIDAEVLSPEKSEDPGFCSAILRFKSQRGAVEAKNMLDGKPNVANEARMIVEICYGSLGSAPFSSSPVEPHQRLSGGPIDSFQTQTSSEPPNSFMSAFESLLSPRFPIERNLRELSIDRRPPVSYQLDSWHFQRHNFPTINPADQNPPCNTLYVGNLPIDTSEDELNALFVKQRGYKRLCFRTNQNGPMCFVEFEDVVFATKALHELYGHPLHNSIKGGIRLSFSKNPLGVRSGGIAGPMARSFSTASGPPPGLVAPMGYPSGPNFSGLKPVPGFTASMPAGPPKSMLGRGNNGFTSAYMMGRDLLG